MPLPPFGTDGMRGPAEAFTHGEVAQHAAAATTYMHDEGTGGAVLIGHDPRESSKRIADALAEGVTNVGEVAVMLGEIPTPGVAYAARLSGKVAAMVTASHNRWTDNGIKFFNPNGTKLTDDQQRGISALAAAGVPAAREIGVRKENAYLPRRYAEFLIESADDATFDGLRVALDMANGAASDYAAGVFTKLGVDVTAMHDVPNGRNINEKCGATDTRSLRERVVADGLNMGAAFDGDADRIVMVDERGREVNGDHIMFILGVTGLHKGIVATEMTNLGTEQALQQHGIALHRTDVGDRYVLEGLRQTGYTLGGEQSGHIILPDLLPTGDGMLAAVQTIRAVRESGYSLAEWRDAVPLIPQKTVNLPLPDKTLLQHEAVQEFIDLQRMLFGDTGRILIRPSGTEALVRVMIESPDAETITPKIVDKFSALLDQIAA